MDKSFLSGLLFICWSFLLELTMPNRKEYIQEYNKRPEVIERRKKLKKEYNQRPEVK